MPMPDKQDQVVVQPILRPDAQQRPRTSAPSGQGRRFGLMGLALIVLLAIAAGVFFYLPTLVQQPEPPAAHAPEATKNPEPTEAAPAKPAEVDYLKLAEQMEKAEQTRGLYDSLFASYDKRHAAQWAGDAFASARTFGEQAAKQFKAREYAAAEESYKKGLDQLQAVGDTATRLVQEQLAAGTKALEQGQSAAARKAFEFALSVDSANAVAAKGLKRAGTLDQVFALTTSAADAERAGNLAVAGQRYQDALKLDPDTTVASEGLARVQSRMSADQFAAALSQAMSALADGKPGAARTALENARRIRPGAPEIQDGLTRAAELERQQQIIAHQQQAEAFERSEHWKEALAEYDAALKLDPALEFALQARVRVQPRLALHQQFEELNSKPDRLLSASVRTQAAALIAEARKISAPGPVLSRQLEQLSASLAQAQKPLVVMLRSDNQTQVVINRVAQLGVFSQHQIELLPGRYVAVGTRQGYRDVRKEFTVMPGQSPDPLTVQCEERI